MMNHCWRPLSRRLNQSQGRCQRGWTVVGLTCLTLCGTNRAGFASLDRADLVSLFKSRASVMKSPPKFLRGAYRSALRVALTEADLGYAAGDDARVSRAWKLYLLLPRMLLHILVRGGLVPKEKLKERFILFTQGRWEDLIFASQQCDADALKASSRRRRTQQGDSVEKRADRALDLIQMGALSAARHALEGDPLRQEIAKH